MDQFLGGQVTTARIPPAEPRVSSLLRIHYPVHAHANGWMEFSGEIDPSSQKQRPHRLARSLGSIGNDSLQLSQSRETRKKLLPNATSAAL